MINTLILSVRLSVKKVNETKLLNPILNKTCTLAIPFRRVRFSIFLFLLAKLNSSHSSLTILTVVLVNVYAPNDPNRQVVFLRGLSNLVLGGDFNCVMGTLDKRGGKPVNIRKASTIELKALIKTHDF